MIFNKTNRITNNGTTNSGGSNSKTESSTTTFFGSSDIQRYIWGQWDNGEDDINGSAYINGNVFVSSQGETEYNEDDDDDEEDRNPAEDSAKPDFNTGNLDDIFSTEKGNLYVEKKLLVDGDIESKEIYGKSLFLDYKNAKTNVLDLFKDYEDRITQCEIDIDNLETKVINIQGDITTINNDITNINGDITDIYNKITNLGDNITNVEGSAITEQRVKEIVESMLPEANPIQVLYAGNFYYYYNDSIPQTQFYKNGYGYKTNLELISRTDGLLKLKAVSTDTNYNDPTIYTCIVQQNTSPRTSDLTKTELNYDGHGAHWYESRITNNNEINIREFHNGSSDKDSWQSSTWGRNNAVERTNIIILGKLNKK